LLYFRYTNVPAKKSSEEKSRVERKENAEYRRKSGVAKRRIK